MVRQTQKALSAVFLALSILALTTTASAAEYQFIVDPAIPADCEVPVPGVGYGNAGILTHLDARFDSLTNELSWTTTFAPCNGRLPDGYWNVINNGPNPKGHSGELAIFYFDASDPANPKLTAYAYNGQNGNQSYIDGVRDDGPTGQPGNQTPDRILSSISGDTSWIQELSVTDAGGERTLHLKIDATDIINHVPLYPDPLDPWYGAGFGGQLGFWLHPVHALFTQYFSQAPAASLARSGGCDVAPGQTCDGYLETFTFRKQGYYDHGYLPTNEVPYCLYTLPNQKKPGNQCIELEIGETFNATVSGVDGNGDSLMVTYSGAPAGAVITPTSGDILPTPADATFSWTPQIGDSGSSYTIDFTFSDQNGFFPTASKVCPLEVCVPKNEPPTCDLALTTQAPICQGAITTIDFSAAGSFDPDQDELTYSWDTTCENSNGQQEQIVVVNNGLGAQVLLTQPGLGQAVNCQMEVTVTDVYGQESTCSVPVEVNGCELDCLGDPNGATLVDECGVCGGNNECFDCAGIPNGGTVVDECGVCGGNNDCVDCLGVVNGTAVVDQCGECNGDGLSCLDCETTDIMEVQFRLDQGAKLQEAEIIRDTNRILKLSKSKKTKAQIDEWRARANELQIDNWVLSWQLPNTINECENTEFCVTVSNTPILDTYTSQSLELQEIGIDVAKLWKRKRIRKLRNKGNLNAKSLKRTRKRSRKLINKHKGIHEANMLDREMVPDTFSSCTGMDQ